MSIHSQGSNEVWDLPSSDDEDPKQETEMVQAGGDLGDPSDGSDTDSNLTANEKYRNVIGGNAPPDYLYREGMLSIEKVHFQADLNVYGLDLDTLGPGG